MKLAYPYLYKPFEFFENKINVFVIESPRMFFNIIYEMKEQCAGQEGNWCLSQDEKSLKINKYLELVTDIFNISLKSTKFTNAIIARMESIAMDSGDYMETQRIKQEILKYSQNIVDKTDLPLEIDQDMNVSAIFKIIGLNIDLGEEKLVSNIIKYMQTMQELFEVKLFVFVNLKSFLEEEDLELLYKEVFYRKINIFLFESKHTDTNNKYEDLRIIDQDMCEIT